MKKSANVDISNLFRKFGGDTENYKEIQRDYINDKAQQAWPIIAAIEKERVTAPKLRMSADVPAAPVAAPVVPAAKSPEPVVPRPLFGAIAPQSAPVSSSGLSSAATEPQAKPFAQVRSAGLFGGIERSVASAEPDVEADVRGAPAGLFAGNSRPVAPSLQSRPERPVAPEVVRQPATPERPAGLFAAVAAKSASSQAEAATADLFKASARSDTLDSVFNRLQKPQNEVAAPDTNLRSLFGFLSK